MFSARLHWNLEPSPIAQRIAAKRLQGDRILDLTESNPTGAGLGYPVQEVVEAFADARIMQYEPNPAGMQSAREAVSNHYQGAIAAERILLTTSTSEAYGYLFKLLTDPGDEIMVPRPSYPLFDFLAGMELVRTVPYPLVYNGCWRIDFESLERMASARTRAIVLVNPNNPTGSFLQTSELEPLVRFCRDRNLSIISDEVFADYGFGVDPDRVQSLKGVDEVLTFCLSGLSKVAGLPQMKLGWIIAGGPAPVRADALNRLELIADTYLSIGTPVQIAAPRLLAAGTKVRNQIRARTARNLAALQGRIGPDSPFRLFNVEGGWYAVLQVPRIRSEEEWVLHLLEHHNVLVQPGFFYDFESEAFLVVSLLTAEDTFDAGISAVLPARLL